MKFISTKDLTDENAPTGKVLVKYLEPSFGGWYCQYGMAYYDNPLDYENPDDARGWLHDVTNNAINVVEYLELPEIDQETENPFRSMEQLDIMKKWKTFTPKLGCASKLK